MDCGAFVFEQTENILKSFQGLSICLYLYRLYVYHGKIVKLLQCFDFKILSVPRKARKSCVFVCSYLKAVYLYVHLKYER